MQILKKKHKLKYANQESNSGEEEERKGRMLFGLNIKWDPFFSPVGKLLKLRQGMDLC